MLGLGFAAGAACTEFESASDGARPDAQALAADGAVTTGDDGSAADAADPDLLQGRGRFEGPGQCSTFALGADAAATVIE